MHTFRFLYPFLRPHLRWYVAGLLMVPLATACGLLIPRLTGDAIESMRLAPEAIDPVKRVCGLILLCALGRAAGLFGSRFFIISASRKVEFDLRNRLFRHLLSLDRPFFDRSRTGDLMSRATADVDATRTVVGPAVMYSMNTSLMLVLALPLMLSVDAVLTVCVLLPLSFLSLSVRLIGPRVQRAFRRAQDTLGDVSSFGQENAAGIRVVKSFAVEDCEIRSFRQLCDRYCEENLQTERIANWMHPIVGAVSHLAVIILMLAGGMMILDRKLTLDQFVELSGYQALLIWPMISIGWVVNQLFRGVASIGRLSEVLATRSSVTTTADLAAMPASVPAAAVASSADRRVEQRIERGEIDVRNLSFGYGEENILTDINLHVPAGATVALIGRTGSGKSTLARLLARLYPVPDRSIYIDGLDINELSLHELRRAVGFVPQETFLFSRSIAANIAFGRDDDGAATRRLEEVRRYAAISRLDKDLDQFAGGLDEVIGERGVTLSGGQRQRVAISRALLYQPKVLVLDDALSAVDTNTEEEIIQNLREATQDLTVVVISHRISSIKDSDIIYVIDHGRIAQSGTHEELLREGGLYEELHKLQLLERELEDL